MEKIRVGSFTEKAILEFLLNNPSTANILLGYLEGKGLPLTSEISLALFVNVPKKEEEEKAPEGE